MEPKKIDLATLDVKKWANDGAVVQLNHPATGEALDIEVQVVGSDSDAYLEMTRELARRRGQQLKRSRQRMATLDDLERDGIELTVACTTGWKNMVIDEQEIPFSVENARKVFTQYTWIREQVDGFVNDRANFLPKAANA